MTRYDICARKLADTCQFSLSTEKLKNIRRNRNGKNMSVNPIILEKNPEMVRGETK